MGLAHVRPSDRVTGRSSLPSAEHFVTFHEINGAFSRLRVGHSGDRERDVSPPTQEGTREGTIAR